MFAVLLAVFVLRLRRSGGSRSGRLIALGVLIGLALVGVALLTNRPG